MPSGKSRESRGTEIIWEIKWAYTDDVNELVDNIDTTKKTWKLLLLRTLIYK
jgi:hypothetical protein